MSSKSPICSSSRRTLLSRFPWMRASAAYISRARRSTSSGRARHSETSTGSLPSISKSSSSIVGHAVSRTIRSISPCRSSSVIGRCQKTSSALERRWRSTTLARSSSSGNIVSKAGFGLGLPFGQIRFFQYTCSIARWPESRSSKLSPSSSAADSPGMPSPHHMVATAAHRRTILLSNPERLPNIATPPLEKRLNTVIGNPHSPSRSIDRSTTKSRPWKPLRGLG